MAHPGTPRITVGIDTHLDLHVGHAGDQLGRRIDTVQVPTTPAGYHDLLAWARGLGQVDAWDVEGTGSYGAALARFLTANDQAVLEVNRPDRQARRRHGTSDPSTPRPPPGPCRPDGHGRAQGRRRPGRDDPLPAGRPRHRDAGPHPGINALKALLVTAPAELREQLRGLPATTLVRTAAELEPGPITSPWPRQCSRCAPLPDATRPCRPRSPRSPPSWTASPPGRRPSWWRCSVSAKTALARCWSPPATTPTGSTARRRSPCCAGHPRSRPPPARPPGIGATGAVTVKPTPRYRIVLVRLCYDQATQDYMARRTKQGKSKKEIIRCLKRYVAREVFAVLHDMRTTDPTTAA
jgi:transposase